MRAAIFLLGLVLIMSPIPSFADDAKAPSPAPADKFQWLEDVEGDKALAWVRERNAESTAVLADNDGFKALESRLLKILDSDARIPYVGKMGDYYFNFWRDAKNPRGLWRRTTLAEYRKAEPAWDTVIDLDALGKAEDENWVWHGADCLKPEYRLCLVSLSRGGADADVVREFDLGKRAFVKDGFSLPEAKSSVSWIDADTLYVATDFGAGSMTESGYPRIAKEWKRGTPLAEARVVYEAKSDDAGIFVFSDHTKGYERDFVMRWMTTFTSELNVRRDGKMVRIDKPDDAQASAFRDLLLLQLRSDWTIGGKTYTAGSLLASNFDAYLEGKREFDVLFEPTERSTLAEFTPTLNHVILNVLDNVRNRLYVLTRVDGKWKREPLPDMPEFGTVSVDAIDDEANDDYFLTITDYITPTSLLLGTLGKGAPELIKQLPAFYDAKGLLVSQHEATSKDGTRIPYFQVARRDLVLDGSNPTLLYGYGGFEVSMVPNYNGSVGSAWLEKGGVYVVANLRGGGEFGPKWHQAALKANRHKVYEDFAAVAQDLVSRKVTSPKHLGVQGGSNGGLLTGNMLVQYPELFGAVVSQVPLLDMRRYHQLLAGASWMGEYGDPDLPQEWAFIQTFSPYHLAKVAADYPPVLFTTSTRDDRVHPGHARKMTALLMDQSHDVLYYENIEGGHGGAANNAQQAYMSALAYTFLWQHLAE